MDDECEYRFRFFDDVFDAFLYSNRVCNNPHTLEEIISLQAYKRRYTYEYKFVPYLAKIKSFYAPQAPCVEIKLICNGFPWPEPPPETVGLPYQRYWTEGWGRLPIEAFYPCAFPKMHEAFAPLANAVAIYYNKTSRDLEIIFKCDHADVIFKFVQGYPYYDDILDAEFRHPLTRRRVRS